MKKNSRYALYIVSILIMSHAAVMGVAIQDKQSMYRYLTELENQKKVVYRVYATALLNAVNQHEKDALYKEYIKKMSIISQQEKKQRKSLQSIHQQELWWSGAKFLGGIALLGLFAYNVLTAGRPLQKEHVIVSESIPLGSKTLLLDTSDSFDTVETSWLEDFQLAQKSSRMSSELQETPMQIKTPLSQSERALYQLRYKNFRDASALSFVSTVAGLLAFGPVALPIDFILFGISALSGAQALHYNAKLNPSEFSVSEGDIQKKGILLDAILAR